MAAAVRHEEGLDGLAAIGGEQAFRLLDGAVREGLLTVPATIDLVGDGVAHVEAVRGPLAAVGHGIGPGRHGLGLEGLQGRELPGAHLLGHYAAQVGLQVQGVHDGQAPLGVRQDLHLAPVAALALEAGELAGGLQPDARLGQGPALVAVGDGIQGATLPGRSGALLRGHPQLVEAQVLQLLQHRLGLPHLREVAGDHAPGLGIRNLDLVRRLTQAPEALQQILGFGGLEGAAHLDAVFVGGIGDAPAVPPDAQLLLRRQAEQALPGPVTDLAAPFQ